MESSSANNEQSIESKLIDLSTVSMTALRKLDDMVFRQALQTVMQQASNPRLTVGGGSGGKRID
jgi:hypothetical protein